MEISYLQVKKIFDTLPVGYYIGRDVQRELSNDNKESFYDPMNDKICISYSFIKEGLKETDEKNIENDVRTLLYHEVSHAFLTPKYLMSRFSERFPRSEYSISSNIVINIFEDERIERIFDNFFLGVDFDEYCKRVNHWTGISKAKNIEEAWYDFIRFRTTIKACEHLLPTIDYIIEKHSLLNANMYRFDVSVTDYCRDVINLFRDFYREWNKDSKKSKSNSKASTDKTDSTSSSISFSDSSVSLDLDIKSENIKPGKSEEKKKESVISKSALKDIINNVTTPYIDDKMIETFKQIFNKNSKITKRNSSAINTYSGMFDARSVVRDDYKFFLQSNRIGHQKAYSKMKLNLFIDRSGSFGSSVNTVNKIIYALQKVEKLNPNFEFDVVTIGMDEQLLPKNNRTFSAHGGNAITPKMTSIYNSLQSTQHEVINILLFDGECYTDCAFENCRYLGCFNNKKSVIISENSNKRAFDKYIPGVKVKYCTNFTDELYKSIITSLQIMMR